MQHKFSPSSKLFVQSNVYGVIAFYKFSNEYASISQEIDLSLITNFGIEFSLDENYLLVESIEKEIAIYHIDSFDNLAIINSKKTLIPSPSERLGSLQLNSRGEVLFAPLNTPYLGKIEFKSDTIKWTKQGYYLSDGRNSYFGTPNFNASYFYYTSIYFAYHEHRWSHMYEFTE